MEPHRFRPTLSHLEARDTPAATPADVMSAALYADGVLQNVEVFADRITGPLRAETLADYREYLPQVAFAAGNAAATLTEFQAALNAQVAANPAAAQSLALYIQRTAELRDRAAAAAAGADFLSIAIGGPSLQQQLANLNATAPGTDGGSTDGANTDPGTDAPTRTPPLSTTDASGMSESLPPLTDSSWQTTASGLRIWDVVEGEGTPAAASSQISVFYTGWIRDDGRQFETNRTGNPNTFALSGLIEGWQEGIVGMKPGGLRRLDIPSELAYGVAGSPPNIPANADLVFEIKMLAVS